MQPRRNSSIVLRLIISLLFLAVALSVFVQRQWIIDHVTVLLYKPSSSVAALANRSEMSGDGKFYFYASRPEVDESTAFNKACGSLGSEKSVVLGCYVNRQIYIYNVTNTQLDGIKEVTAAHEMLHAAYDRLSKTEQDHVNSMITEQLKSITDERITNLIALYDKTEPGERLNELHSILGTEVSSLNPDLEQYYSQYFDDRQAVVKLSAGYERIFTGLREKQASLSSDLDTLYNEITALNTAYGRDATQFKSDVETFNAQTTSGQLTESQYNSQRAALLARQSDLQAKFNDLQAKITTYNQKRDELASINSQADTLNRSIDSTVTPVPGV